MDYHIYHTDTPPTPEQEEVIRSQLVIITNDRDQAYQDGYHWGYKLGFAIGLAGGLFAWAMWQFLPLVRVLLL